MVLDSGASHHMLNDSRYFTSLSPIAIDITTGNRSDGNQLKAVAQGTAAIQVGNGQIIHLRDALYVPKITCNLLSLVQLVQANAQIVPSPRWFPGANQWTTHLRGQHRQSHL
jgi:hypothetical protein